MIYKISSLLLCLFFMISCSDNDDVNMDSELNEIGIPLCLEGDTMNNMWPTIRVQEINGEKHFWLNTGANAVDGDEFIINAQCDTVCRYAGWAQADCISAYDDQAWEQIWP